MGNSMRLIFKLFTRLLKKINYYLIFLLSNKYYSYKIIHVDANGKIQSDYKLTLADMKQQPNSKAPACPDPTIQFVAGTPITNPNITSARKYVDKVFQQAVADGYKSVELVQPTYEVVFFKRKTSTAKIPVNNSNITKLIYVQEDKTGQHFGLYREVPNGGNPLKLTINQDEETFSEVTFMYFTFPDNIEFEVYNSETGVYSKNVPTAYASTILTLAKTTDDAKQTPQSKATVENYENYLMCPQLKGFYNVGHGANNDILLTDGVLTKNYFITYRNTKKHTVILFNSCDTFNDPLKDSIINFARAQKYIAAPKTFNNR